MVSQVAILIFVSFLAFASAYPSNSTYPTISNEAPSTGRGLVQSVASNLAARFLTPATFNTLQSMLSGFGNSALSSALSFNAANVVVVALIVGAALLLGPIILGWLGLATGAALGTGRALPDDHKNYMTVNVYKAIDDFFRTYNIDAPVCMQRFACTAARKSAESLKASKSASGLAIMDSILNSGYVQSTLGQTRFMEAVKFGKTGGDCEIEYGKCPFSLEKLSNYFWVSGSSSSDTKPKAA